MKSFDKWKNEKLKEPEFRKEYEKQKEIAEKEIEEAKKEKDKDNE